MYRSRSASPRTTPNWPSTGSSYYQVTDPRLASYGTSDYVTAIVQLAQTTLRSEVGKMELDQSPAEPTSSTARSSMCSTRPAALGRESVALRGEELDPPETILRAMQAQITAEREKRAHRQVRGEKQQEINLAEGEKQAAIPHLRRAEAVGDQQGAGGYRVARCR